jgi:hypothetical protein
MEELDQLNIGEPEFLDLTPALALLALSSGQGTAPQSCAGASSRPPAIPAAGAW